MLQTMDLDEWMYENWISSTIEDLKNEVDIELGNQDQEMQIEMEAEEKEHQYLFWLEATVNEFQKPVLEAAKERMLELGIPSNFRFFILLNHFQPLLGLHFRVSCINF
jgi:hypothetical protein